MARVDKHKLIANVCRASYKEFVHRFWPHVPGAGTLIWNWHLGVLCDELQRVAERVFKGLPKEHDIVFNVAPGTSKSTICSILFQPWTWTRMPEMRHITASHTDVLVLDLASKSREVVRSELYQNCFPEIQIRPDQDVKSYWANTAGGDRFTCTVAGKSPTGQHAHVIVVDDPIDPKKAMSEASLKEAKEFMTQVIPSRKVNKEVSVTFLVMQRLRLGDPSDVMLERNKKEPGSVKSVCIPAILENEKDREAVSPPELLNYYSPEGLMDPVRQSQKALKEQRSILGEYGFVSQYKQQPTATEGSMFKEIYFNQRVKAAPYQAKRIRYFDRASSTGETACYTAGTLMAKTPEGFFVEHVVHGRWEPDERNQVMLATALRDRSRYGPKFEPVIWVEAEGGSSGRDAWKGVVRALAGFYVREDRVSGKKHVRAEPWSSQLAAKNVFFVDDGSWDIQGLVTEHLLFPTGQYLDIVDSCSGAFNLLAGVKATPTLHTYALKDKKKLSTRIVACSKDELSRTVIDKRGTSLLVVIEDPPIMEGIEIITVEHTLSNCTGTYTLRFIDSGAEERQATWLEPIPPWNRPASALVADTKHGKGLWAFLTKKRPSASPDLIAIVDSGGEDRRALSVALAICDVLRLPRAAVYQPRLPDFIHENKAPNTHVYSVMKSSRSLVY